MSIVNEILSIVSTAVDAAKRGIEVRKEIVENDIIRILQRIVDGEKVFEELEGELAKNRALEASYRARLKGFRSSSTKVVDSKDTYDMQSVKADMELNAEKLAKILKEVQAIRNVGRTEEDKK